MDIFQFSDKNPQASVAYASTDVMHTSAEVILPYFCKEESERIISDLWDELRREDAVFNRFARSSDIARINEKGGETPIEVSEEIFMVLEMCSLFNKATLGYFDITANAASRTSSEGESYSLDTAAHTVKLNGRSKNLDLGGFAKGYALGKLREILTANSVGCALINLGNSSTLAVGHHPYGEFWPVSIAHTYFTNREAYTIHLADASLSVSGRDNSGNGHIIDPFTGNTISKPEMIAASGPSPLVAEVLSTALYVAPKERRAEILRNFEGYNAVEVHCATDGKSNIITIQ